MSSIASAYSPSPASMFQPPQDTWPLAQQPLQQQPLQEQQQPLVDPASNKSCKQNKGASAFIKKLYSFRFSMINDARFQNRITWSTSGSSFFIYNAKAFANQVLPVYFKHGNFSSFVRQLNMYGFHKINKSTTSSRQQHQQYQQQQQSPEGDVWEFSHTQFMRDRSDLLPQIRRKTVDADGLRRESGDLHTSVAIMQTAQSELVQQFQELQSTFQFLQSAFGDLQQNQMRLQYGIRKVIATGGVLSPPGMWCCN
ncbi:HSF-type DNA-binding-domain-containing protein [Syncephalastrum racemosum]|uniref:HSF-type DNA-binding-domain-containing protein n=1 Tax=Syncephalastrum racemosum TaxID=13706 RepID=A0A1X2HJA6_SYNRA|nr:HSF-type DNA-binding-domain-containing protein [Syncephalastrum racemosum]